MNRNPGWVDGARIVACPGELGHLFFEKPTFAAMAQWLTSWLPILGWLPNYQRQHLRGDLMAGLTVGFMLIPQGMAYAMIAGMPPIYGLYAAIVPMLAYSIFGTSRQLSVGPVALDSLLVASGLSAFAVAGTENYIQLAFVLAVLVGVVQIAAGFLRLGFFVNFVSQPVISGFTSAAAIVIMLSQLPHLLGVKVPRSDHAHEMVIEAAKVIHLTHWPTLLFALGGIGLILGLRRLHKGIPGALVAVVLATAATWAFNLEGAGLKVVGAVPAGLPAPLLPAWDWATVKALLPTALTLALVAFMEAYSVGKAMEARLKDHRILPNQELRALGIGNLLGGIFQCFPTAGGLSRTAVNAQAGARTNLAGLISVAFIVLTLLWLTPLFQSLPSAILASVIMVAVIALIDWRTPVRLWYADRGDFFRWWATFGVTLLVGVMAGIGTGVLLSIISVVYRSATPHMAVLGRIPGSRNYRNIDRFPDAEVHPEILAMRLDAQLYFANAGFFAERVLSEVGRKGPELKMVLIDAEAISFVDSTGADSLRQLSQELKTKGILLYISGAKGPVRDALHRNGLIQVLGKRAIYMHASEAVEAWERAHGMESKLPVDECAVQTNVLPKPKSDSASQ
jgi:sulfate permease, SulP family